MFKYLLLALFVSELYGWEISSILGRHFGEQLETFDVKAADATNFTEHYFLNQKLNHFDSRDTRKWHQRYFVNDQHYKSGGPIFLMIGGRNVYSDYVLRTSGAWLNYAKQFGALCVLLEHRYYGASWPTNDVSIENLQYLTSQQALGDIAEVIRSINELYNTTKDVKWIAFGGDYAGSLAAWLRLKYPHLVHGAVASSAPLQTAIAYPKFFSFVEEKLGNHSSECVSAVKSAFADLNVLLQDPKGQEEVKQKLHLCPSSSTLMMNYYDIANLNFRLALYFARAAVLDSDHEGYRPVDVTCDIMTNSTLKDSVSRLDTLVRRTMGDIISCLPYEVFAEIDYLLIVDWDIDSRNAARQVLYQQCTEFGVFLTPDEPTQVFGNSFSLSFYDAICYYVFGPQYTWDSLVQAEVRAQNTYGGTHLDVTNVAFVQGSEDPFNSLGVVKDLNPTAPVILIEGAHAREDMSADSPQDTAELKAAREKIAKYLETLLQK